MSGTQGRDPHVFFPIISLLCLKNTSIPLTPTHPPKRCMHISVCMQCGGRSCSPCVAVIPGLSQLSPSWPLACDFLHQDFLLVIQPCCIITLRHLSPSFFVMLGNCPRLISIFPAWHIVLLLPWQPVHYTACDTMRCNEECWLKGEKCYVMKGASWQGFRCA